MLKAGVIGHPIFHSKSPLIHGHWLNIYGINGEYKTYDIAPDDLKTGVIKLIDEGLKGFNVTLPHKQNIMDLCKTLSNEAQIIGAVNTVTILDDGSLHGHNTDAYGFSQNLSETIPDFDWTHKIVTVIGAGGTTRAILYALRQNNCHEIRLTNRTRDSAEKIGSPYHAKIVDWDMRSEACINSDLVINTTSLGMNGQPDLEIDLSGMAKNGIVYDIVYHPLQTPLLKQALEKGMQSMTGIGMLLHQARPGFKSWFGVYPEVTETLTHILLKK